MAQAATIENISFIDQGVALYQYVSTDIGEISDQAYTCKQTYTAGEGQSRIITQLPLGNPVQPAVACAESAAQPNVTVSVSLKGLTPGKPWSFEASYLIGASRIDLFKAHGGAWDGKPVACPLIPAVIPTTTTIRPLPWGYNGDLKYTITSDNKAGSEQTIPFSFYVVSQYLHRCFRQDGLSLELLQQPNLLPQWMASPPPAPEQARWPGFVTNALFCDNRMGYDSWAGEQAYLGNTWASSTDSSDNATILWIDLWLSDMNGISKRSAAKAVQNERYAVNCADLAVLVEVIGSLGALQQSSVSVWRSPGTNSSNKFFGYIKPTYLIGIHKTAGAKIYSEEDRCNNPFFRQAGKSQDLMCAPDDPKRSSFGGHAIAIETVGSQLTVLDATEGARFITAKDQTSVLQAFLEASVDPTRRLNAAEQKLATVEDFKSVKAIEHLALRPSVARGLSKDSDTPTPAVTIYDMLITLWKSLQALGYTFEVPRVGSVDKYSSMISTWTVRKLSTLKDQSQGEVHINISRSSSEESASKDYKARRSVLSAGSYQEEGSNNYLTLDKPGACYAMFYFAPKISDSNGKAVNGAFVLTVDGSLTKSELQKENTGLLWNLRNQFNSACRLQDYIGYSLESPAADPKAKPDPSWWAPSLELAVKRGERIPIVVKPNQAITKTWRGLITTAKDSKAQLTRARVVDKGERILLEFILDSKISSEDIALSLYGPNLEQLSKTVKVNVT